MQHFFDMLFLCVFHGFPGFPKVYVLPSLRSKIKDYARIQYMKRHNKRSAERRLLLTFHGRAPLIHEAYSDCAVRGELMKLSRTRNLQDGVS